jgi:hypothetical protein
MESGRAFGHAQSAFTSIGIAGMNSMDSVGRNKARTLGGWRRWWTGAAGLYLAVIMLLILALFPSRADFTRAWRIQALDIERQFDMGLRGIDRQLIHKRYAGLDDRDTVALVKEKFERMYPQSRQLDSSEAVTSRYLNGGTTAVAARSADMLVWRDNDGIRLTRETADRLRDELQQLDSRYSQKLRTLPLQKSRALGLGLLIGAVALGLLYLLGLRAERPRATAAPELQMPEPLPTMPTQSSLPSLAGFRHALGSLLRPTLGH